VFRKTSRIVVLCMYELVICLPEEVPAMPAVSDVAGRTGGMGLWRSRSRMVRIDLGFVVELRLVRALVTSCRSCCHCV